MSKDSLCLRIAIAPSSRLSSLEKMSCSSLVESHQDRWIKRSGWDCHSSRKRKLFLLERSKPRNLMNSLLKNLETRSFSWWEPIYIYRLQLLQIAIELSVLSAICWPVTPCSFAAVCILREGTEQQIIICCVYNHHKIKKKVAEIVIWWVIC